MKFRRIVLNLAAALLLALAVMPATQGPAYAMTAEGGGAADPSGGSHADDPPPPDTTCPDGNGAKGQVLQGLGETGSNCDDSQVNKTFKTAVTLLSMVVGILSVIVILVSGMKFMLSGGDSNKVSNAKNSLIYALVGVAVAALAQLLIHFVLFQTN
jgi:hypothetical protein